MTEIKFSNESNMLIDFTKELITEYNESLIRELKNFKYKVNFNDSYERTVYLVNGKKMKKYTDRLKNSLKVDLEKKILCENQEMNNHQIDGIIFKEIVDILKTINIQSDIIKDVIVNFSSEDKLCRYKYDLNIYDNNNLYFTHNCLEINYNKLTKPVEKYIDESDNKKKSTVKSIAILCKLADKINDEENDFDYQTAKTLTKFAH